MILVMILPYWRPTHTLILVIQITTEHSQEKKAQTMWFWPSSVTLTIVGVAQEWHTTLLDLLQGGNGNPYK
jgi:hypothetical protein